MSSVGGPCQRLLYDRAQRGLLYLHVGERWLYCYWYEDTYGDGPLILRAPKDGSAEPEPIAQVGTLVTVESDDKYAYSYWIEFGPAVTQAMRLAHEGGGAEPLALGLAFDYPTLVRDEDGEHLIVADSSCINVARWNTTTLEVAVLRDRTARGGGGGTWLETDDETVYCMGLREYDSGEGTHIVAMPSAAASRASWPRRCGSTQACR